MRRSRRTLALVAQQNRGSVLVFAVVLLALLALISTGILFTVRQGVRISQNAAQSVEANLAADAGLAHAQKVLRDTITTRAIYTPEGIFRYNSAATANEHPWLQRHDYSADLQVPLVSPLRFFTDSNSPIEPGVSRRLSVNPDTLEIGFTSSLLYADNPEFDSSGAPVEYARRVDVIGFTSTFYNDADNGATPTVKPRTLPRISGARGAYFVWVSDLDAKLYAVPKDTNGTLRNDWGIDASRTIPPDALGYSAPTEVEKLQDWENDIRKNLLTFSITDADSTEYSLGEPALLEELDLLESPITSADKRFPHFSSTNELSTQLTTLYSSIDPLGFSTDYELQRAELDHYFTVYQDRIDRSSPLSQKCVKSNPTAFNINTATLEQIAAAISQIPGQNPPYDVLTHDPDIHDAILPARALALAKRIVSKRPFLCRMDFEDFLAAHIRGLCTFETDYDMEHEPSDADIDQPANVSGASSLPVVRILYYAMNRRLGPGYVADTVANPKATDDNLYYADPSRTELSLAEYLEIPGAIPANCQHLKIQISPTEEWWPNEPRYQKLRFQFFFNNDQGLLPLVPRTEALITTREFNNIVNSLFNNGDDVQNIQVGTTTSEPVVTAGADGILQTAPVGDDQFLQKIIPGVNGLLDSGRNGDDLIVGGEVRPGPNGVIDTPRAGDDQLIYDETIIWAGPNGIAETRTLTSRPSYYSFIDDIKFAEKFWDSVDDALSVQAATSTESHLLNIPLNITTPCFGIRDTLDADRRASLTMKFYYRLPIHPAVGPIPPYVVRDLCRMEHLVSWRCQPSGMPPTTPFDPEFASDQRNGFFQITFNDWSYYLFRAYGPLQVMGDPDIYSFGIDDTDVTILQDSAAKPWSGRIQGLPFDANKFGGIEVGEDSVGNGDVSWSPSIAFRSRFFKIYTLGLGMAAPERVGTPVQLEDLKSQGEKRIEAVYDALLDQIIWQRSPITDKRALGEPAP